MFGRFGLIADFIIDHRWLTFFLILCVTGVAFVGHYDPYLLLPQPTQQLTNSGNQQTSESEDERLRSAPNIQTVRVASGDVIVVAQCDDFFTPDSAEAIRSAVDAIEALPHVARVFWMDLAPMMNIFGLPEPILPSRNASEERFQQAKLRAREHPLVLGQLLSEDAKTTLLMVEIDWLYVTDDADCTDLLRDTAAEAVSAFPNVQMKFRVTGEVPIRLSRAASTRENEFKYQAIGYTIAVLFALVLFRGLSAVFIVALAPTLGVFWTLGALHLIGWDDNPFNSVIVPVLLCMVGFTDGVHMMVQIRKHRSEGMSAADAAKKSIREVGLACWLTSLTTAIGFGSLVLARHEVVQEFGYCCVIGVGLTFVAVITVIPLCCATPLGNRVHIGYGKNVIDRNIGRISGIVDFVLKKPRTFSWIAIVSTIVLAFFTLQLRPDERLTSNLASGSEAAQALAHIDKTLGGMETAQVSLRWNANCPDGSAEIAEAIQKVHAVLDQEPLLGYPLSIVRLIDALPGEGEASTRMSMLELLPPPLKRAYYHPESRSASVVFRLQDLGIAKYGSVFERLEKKIALLSSEHPDFTIKLSGNAIWRWRDLYRIVVDLAYSLGTASLIIFLVLTFVYRSIRLGLISVIPNLFPLATTGFLLLVSGQNLEIVSVCAFTVCLGIAVDDTIHFMTRFQEERRTTSDAKLALRQSFVSVGSALVITTLVLVIGFSTALVSDARDHRIFATMGILTITSALFADMVFLPALLLRFSGKNKNEP